MLPRFLRIGAMVALGAGVALADFSYEQTTKITGGIMAKLAGTFARKALEPTRTAVIVKGDRMATVGPQAAHIIDLSKETITDVNFQKKTYSVITFAQMKQALEHAAQRARGRQGEAPEMNVSASVKETGQTRQIAGLNAREVILTFEMEAADAQSGGKGGMVVTADMWLAPNVAGYNEVREFHQRMAAKLDWTPGSFPSMGQAGLAKGMAQLAKEAAKLDGVPVLQITKMGGKGEAGGAPAAQSQPAPEGPAARDAAEGAAVGAAAGRLGGRLGGLGGLGGLGRRKKSEPKEPEKPATPAPQPSQQPSGAAGAPASLFEATTELSGFSSALADASKFEVPAGFKQVESEMIKALR